MAVWVSGYERTPVKETVYFCKANGYKHLLRLDEFWRKMDISETFYWLDESEDEKVIVDKIYHTRDIDEFYKLDYYEVAKINARINPKIKRSYILNLIRKYYLKEIANLRWQLLKLSKEVGKQKLNGNYIPPPQKEDPLLRQIRLLNQNPFINIR